MGLNDGKRRTLWIEQNGICLYCKKKMRSAYSPDSVLDHIYPKSRGGTAQLRNMALVHPYCNALKADFISLWEVVRHFGRVFALFWTLIEIKKVQDALEDGKMISNGRTQIPNPISQMAPPPERTRKRSLRVEAYERRLAAFQRSQGTPAPSTPLIETPQTGVQDS